MHDSDAYRLQFPLQALRELDEFALIACQSYNLGNTTDWFSCFRGGIYAVHHRVFAICRHYHDVHAWLPEPRIFGNVEHHLADLLFNLDSAMECLVYGLNALGFAWSPEGFLDVTDRHALRSVRPENVMGPRPLPGYDLVYPNFRACWMKHGGFIRTIAEQHDVAKHRSVAFHGGRMRDDPPPGYFDRLDIADDPMARAQYSPMAEIILIPDPKAPPVGRPPTPRSEQIVLEELVPAFRSFFDESLKVATADAKATIALQHPELRRGEQ